MVCGGLFDWHIWLLYICLWGIGQYFLVADVDSFYSFFVQFLRVCYIEGNSSFYAAWGANLTDRSLIF